MSLRSSDPLCYQLPAWLLLMALSGHGQTPQTTKQVPTTTPPSQVLDEAKTSTSAKVFQGTLAKFKVNLNLTNAAANDYLALIPVRERWDFTLKETRTAVVGAIYCLKPIKTLNLGSGAFIVQANQSDQTVRWVFLKPDGSPAGEPLLVQVEQLTQDVAVPRAEILMRSPARCCFTVDRIRHCQECD